jgi:hypothetical protein
MITIQNFWGKQNRWYVCSRYFIPGDMHATDISYQVIHVHVYHAFVPYTCRYMYHIECNFKLKRLCDKSPSIFLGFLTSLTSATNPTNITISRNIKSGTRRYPATVAMCRISTHQTGIDCLTGQPAFNMAAATEKKVINFRHLHWIYRWI